MEPENPLQCSSECERRDRNAASALTLCPCFSNRMESCSFHTRNHIQSSCSEATEKSKFLNGEGGVEPACLPLSDEMTSCMTLLETTGFCSGLGFFPKGGHGDITCKKDPTCVGKGTNTLPGRSQHEGLWLLYSAPCHLSHTNVQWSGRLNN